MGSITPAAPGPVLLAVQKEDALQESEAEAEMDFAKVVDEIDASARRLRLSGEIDPRVEAELEEAFSKYAPMSARSDNLTSALRSLGSATLIDVNVPTASSIPGGTFVKRLIRKAFGWYLNYLAQQVKALGLTSLGAIQGVAARLSALERSLQALLPVDPLQDDEPTFGLADRGGSLEHLTGVDNMRSSKPSGSADRPESILDARNSEDFQPEVPIRALADTVVQALLGSNGRLLHAECGDGWLLRNLGAHGLDAYGVDPRRAVVARLIEEGLDAWDEPAIVHLSTVKPASLSAVILTGLVERLPLATKRELLSTSVGALKPNGRLFILSVSPQYWRDHVSEVQVDLSPGHPLHERTWQSLMTDQGLALEQMAVPDSAAAYIVCGAKR